DWPMFRNKSDAAYAVFDEYIRSDYNKEQFENRLRLLRDLPPAERLDNRFVAGGARALFACGEREATRLRRDFPEVADRVHATPFGIRVADLPLSLSKEALKKVQDLGPFVFCVGRLETRKNQLMLLKALEDDDLTILFGTGGFTYQAEYENLCRTFRRRGRTSFLGRVHEHQLSVIYSFASCHALPSWYELPGLVSIEAVAMGCPAVASSWGGIEDYLPENSLFTCEPDNPDSIRNAVLKAIEAKPSAEAIEHARGFTWERSAEKTLEHYENILSHTEKRLRLREEIPATLQAIGKDSTMIKAKTPLEPQFDCSIILCVQNDAEATQACLEAISTNESDFTYEVIIVDNGSTDSTPKLLAAIEGDVQILTQKAPLPYPHALNLAAAKARGNYLLFLNPTTEPRPESLKMMLTTAQTETDVYAVGAVLTRPDQTIEHMGFAFRDNKVPFSLYRDFPANHDVTKRAREFQAVGAACLLVRQSRFEQIGGFDEQMPSSFADIDLCLRLRMSGGKITIPPNASVLFNGTKTLIPEYYSQQDLQQFLGRWASKITADSDKITAEDGYRIEWDESGRPRYNKNEAFAKEQLEEVQAQRSAGDHDSEWKILAKLVRSGTGTLDSIREFAELSQELKRAEEAEKIFADLKPDNQISFEHARLLYHLKQFEPAAQKLKEVTKHSNELSETVRFEVWQLLGNCYTRLQQSEAAEEAYYHALSENPSSERPYLGLGSVALTEQNWQAAQYGF
ncbi:glycosyltransferase, partial [bacterium]|nr:glycosyltransferase [bacterium]